MKTQSASSIGETRIRDKVPFFQPVKVSLKGDRIEETFKQQGLSINPVSVTIQVGMTDPLFDHLGLCFQNKLDVTLSTGDALLDDRRIILRHTRRFKTVLTKWIFSFTRTLGSSRLNALETKKYS